MKNFILFLACFIVLFQVEYSYADTKLSKFDFIGPKDFLKHVPTAWDDTKLIDGYPGEKVIIARRKGNQWYIGGLNGKDEAQTLEINFDFLGKGNYDLNLIKDGNDSKSFSYESIKVKKGDSIKIVCLPRGGFVGTLKITNN